MTNDASFPETEEAPQKWDFSAKTRTVSGKLDGMVTPEMFSHWPWYSLLKNYDLSELGLSLQLMNKDHYTWLMMLNLGFSLRGSRNVIEKVLALNIDIFKQFSAYKFSYGNYYCRT